MESLSTAKIERLKDTNLHTWKLNIQLVLGLNDFDQYVDEDRSVDDSLQKAWECSDRKAQATIGLAPSDEHLARVSEATTAKKM